MQGARLHLANTSEWRKWKRLDYFSQNLFSFFFPSIGAFLLSCSLIRSFVGSLFGRIVFLERECNLQWFLQCRPNSLFLSLSRAHTITPIHPLILPLFPLLMLFPIHFCQFSCLFYFRCTQFAFKHHHYMPQICPSIARLFHAVQIYIRHRNHLRWFCEGLRFIASHFLLSIRIDLTGNPKCIIQFYFLLSFHLKCINNKKKKDENHTHKPLKLYWTMSYAIYCKYLQFITSTA